MRLKKLSNMCIYPSGHCTIPIFIKLLKKKYCWRPHTLFGMLAGPCSSLAASRYINQGCEFTVSVVKLGAILLVCKMVNRYLQRHQLTMELRGNFQKEVMLALPPKKLFTAMTSNSQSSRRMEHIANTLFW